MVAFDLLLAVFYWDENSIVWTIFTAVYNNAAITVNHYLCLVVEIYLDHFVI